MYFTRTGKIAEGFFVVGHPGAPLYLLEGPLPVLFDAGFTALARIYEKTIKEILGDRTPGLLFITHAHWDHIGAAAYLKKLWPDMKIAGSKKVKTTLIRQEVIQKIRDLNADAVEVIRAWGVQESYEGPFEVPTIDLELEPGQAVELEQGIHVEPIATPGHTWDFFSYWVPEKKLLIASEAVVCDDTVDFLVDYDAYQRSLETLSKLDVEILCTGHYAVVTGTDAQDHILRSMEQAAEYTAMVERFLKEEGEDIAQVVDRIKKEEWDPKPQPKQPESSYLINTAIRVRTIRHRLKRTPPQH